MYTKTQRAEVDRMLFGADSKLIRKMNRQGIYHDEAGRTIVSNDIAVLRLSEGLEDYPIIAAKDYDKYFNDALYSSTEDTLLPLPKLSELRQFITACHKAGKDAYYDFGVNKPLVDARRLVGVLVMLPGCRAWAGADIYKPLYFADENGNDAILCPVNKTWVEAKNKRQSEDL